MRAVVVDRWMEPSELRVSEAPEPQLRPGTLAVDVKPPAATSSTS